MALQLDYSIDTPEGRVEYVEALLAKTPRTQINNVTLSYLSDYILFVGDKNQTKKERKAEKPIITRNRETTIDKRQISYEGIVATLENGEDGLHSMIRQDKNQILDPKDPISQKDINNIPGMQDYMDTIESLKHQFNRASGAAR